MGGLGRWETELEMREAEWHESVPTPARLWLSETVKFATVVTIIVALGLLMVAFG